MTPNSWLRLPTPHAVGRGPRRRIRVMASQPPSSVIAACRTVSALPLAAQRRRAALTRRCTVSTVGGPLQGAPLEPHPDRVAEQRDDERGGPGLAPLQRPGQRVGPVTLLPCRAEDPAVDLGPDRLRRVAVEHPGHGGHVHADCFGDVDQAGPPGSGRPRRARARPGLPVSRGYIAACPFRLLRQLPTLIPTQATAPPSSILLVLAPHRPSPFGPSPIPPGTVGSGPGGSPA